MTTSAPNAAWDAFQAQVSDASSAALSQLAQAGSVADLEKLRVAALGKKGSLSNLLAQMGKMDAALRPEAGKLVNDAKVRVTEQLEAKLAQLGRAELNARLERERIDVTLPGTSPKRGHRHPLRQTLDDIVAIFKRLGFRIAVGPEIESDFYNFAALNFPADHPARDMQDTFHLSNGLLLRTHTSPLQIRGMLAEKPPLALLCPGKVYRVDSDVTHSPMFLQLEGLVVDDHTTFADLKGLLHAFIREFFGNDVQVRFRPSFFPFTEPSAEVDIAYTFKIGGSERTADQELKWMEVLGCGMVHPNVLRNVGLNPSKVQGFAFGLGIDRFTMLRHGITDIRLLYENDQRFLEQF